MKIQFKLAFCFMLVFTLNNNVFAQKESIDSTKTKKDIYVIIKNDGNELVGEILSDNGREVLILTKSIGKVYVNKSDIQEMKIISPEGQELDQSGKQVGYIPRGVFTTRYYFTNNALPNKKGDHYALLNLYGPEVHFALSDKFSLGVMTTWIGSPLALASKYSFKTKKEKINFSLGTIMGTSGFLGNFMYYGGLHWGTATFGDRSKNFSVSAGYVYIGKIAGSLLNNGPIVSLAGIIKVGKKASLFFDSMVLLEGKKTYTQTGATIYSPPDMYGNQTIVSHEPDVVKKVNSLAMFIMPGMRFQQTEKKAFQFALAGVCYTNSNGDLVSFPLPMCSWFLKF